MKHDGQGRAAAECSGECFDPGSHVVRRTIEPARQPDDEPDKTIFLVRQPRNLGGGAVERISVQTRCSHDADRTRQGRGRVAHRHTNPALPHIKSSYATHSV